jgi:histidyl-tRNA synthetase
MRQADRRQVEWAAIVGDDEMREGSVTLKNMKTGEQAKYKLQEAVEKVR